MLFTQDFSVLILVLPIILVSLVIHELAHAYTATAFGDPIPRLQGRLTLNPLAHLDPMGFIFMLVAGFGWAKPVVFDPSSHKRPKLVITLVSLAGPFSNFLLAFILTGVLLALGTSGLTGQDLGFKVVYYGVFINLGLGIFNLLPIPPLDGSHVVLNFLPARWEHMKASIYKYGALVLLLILLLNSLAKIDLLPIGEWTRAMMRLFLDIIKAGLGFFFP